MSDLSFSVTHDPRVVVSNKRSYAILKGSKDSTWNPFPAIGGLDAANITFNNPVPSSNIIVDRHAYITYYLNIAFTFSSGTLGLGTTDSLRGFPMTQSIISTSMLINGANSQVQTSNIFPWLLRTHNSYEQLSRDYSTAPSMLSEYQSLGDWKTYGSGRNAMASFGENQVNSANGGFPMVLSGTGTTTPSISCTVTEPIFLSPMLFTQKQVGSGLIGITSFGLTLNMGPGLANGNSVWYHDATNGSPLTSIAVTFTKAPVLLLNYLTPTDITPIPKKIIYPFFKLTAYTMSNFTLAAGASNLINGSTISINSIPRRIYIFARQQDSDRTYNSSDAMAVINSVNMNWNNRNSYLSSCSQLDLYNMAVRNGIVQSFPAWSFYTGSLLPIEMGVDIGLDNLCPGLNGNYQLSFGVNFTNPGSSSITYTFYVITVEEGTLGFDNGQGFTKIGVMTPTEAALADSFPIVSYKKAEDVYGGAWYDFIVDAAKKVYDVGKTVAPFAKDVFKLGKDISSAFGKGLVGGARRMKKVRGGELLSRSDMREALEEID